MAPILPSIIVACAIYCAASPAEAKPKKPIIMEERVRHLLSSDCAFTLEEYRELIGLGRRAFPVFKDVLSSASSDPRQVTRTLSFLREVKAGKEEFLELALGRLPDKDPGVRMAAILLVGSIGKPGSASPLVALLCDAHEGVQTDAARVIGEIGRHPEKIALTIWQKNQGAKSPKEIRDKVSLAIETIDKRLKTRKLDK